MGTVSGPAGCLCTFIKTCRNATLDFQATDPNHQTASNDGEKHKYAGISFKVDQPRSVLIQMFFCFGDWSKTIVPCFGFECPFTSFGFARARSVLIHPHFFVAHVTHVSYHRGAKNSPEHDPNPGGRWQVCPVDDQRRTTRRQKEAKCTSKRRIEAGIKPAERNNCKSGEPLRQLRQPRFNPKATWILHHHSTFFIPMWVRTIPVQQFEGSRVSPPGTPSLPVSLLRCQGLRHGASKRISLLVGDGRRSRVGAANCRCCDQWW